VAGLLAGLLGVGGGLIIVPALLWLFVIQGLETPHLMQLAVGTSLASIVFTSLSSIYAHHRHQAVLWPKVLALTPGILVGALLGALLADQLASQQLTTLFALFEVLVALQMWFGRTPQQQRQLSNGVMNLAGIIIGAFSALIGIGGGTLTVPFLSAINTPIRQAVATSAACGLPIALAGTVGFIVIGWGNSQLPAGSWGYLYPPALLGIVISSVLFAPLGARLAHRLPTVLLKRFFAGFLLVLGLKLLIF